MQTWRATARGLVFALAIGGCSDEPVLDLGGTTSTTGGSAESSGAGVDASSSGAGSTSAVADASTSVDPSGASTGPATLLDVGAPETGGVIDSCQDAPDEIHVLVAENPAQIWAFHVEDVSFTFVTELDCPELADAVSVDSFSMDREGRVWTLSRHPEDPEVGPYWPMQFTTFDPVSHACDVQWYGAIMDSHGFGVDCGDIAFASTVDDPDHERLFTHACTGGGFTFLDSPFLDTLYRYDPQQDTPVPEALSADIYTTAPLAGTGHGRLYGVAAHAAIAGSTVVIEYDQDTGAILQTIPAADLDLGDNAGQLALAFYAGDLFAFGIATGPGVNELLIHRFDLDDDDGDGVHEVTKLEPAVVPFLEWTLVASASPTCIPTGPAG